MVGIGIKFIVDAEGEGAGSELSQFSCSAGDDAEGGKAASTRAADANCVPLVDQHPLDLIVT